MKLSRIIFALPIIAIAIVDDANATSSMYGIPSETPVYSTTARRNVQTPRKKFDEKFYVGARFDFNLASFSNKYSVTSDPADNMNDSFSFAQQLGFDAVFGWQFDPRWRAEFNYINSGKYSDKDSGGSFDISSHLFMLNGIYTINTWRDTSVYAGFGLGAGMLTTKHANIYFMPDAELSKTSIGFAGQAMVGIEEKISDRLYLGLVYKLSYMTGHQQEIKLNPLIYGSDGTFISKTSGILNNTFGVGLRLEF